MFLSAPTWLVIAPLLAALAVLALGRWRRAAAVTGVVLAVLLWLWLRLGLPEGAVEEMLLADGRSLTLTEDGRSLLLLYLMGLVLLLLLSLAWPQGPYFAPAALATLSPLTAALMTWPSAPGALFWLMVAALTTIVIQSGRAGRTQAALRYLALTVLAAPLLLVAGWMLAVDQVALQLSAGRLLALALAILLAGFPFHIWVRPAAAEGTTLATAFVFGLVQLVVVVLAYRWLAAYPWLQTEPGLISLWQWSSGLAALTAGLLALTAVDHGRLLGSLLLLDMSVSLALLTVPLADSWETAVSLPLVRFVGLLLVAVGFGGLGHHQAQGSNYAAFRGQGRRAPLAAITLALGLFSLLGLPLTIGFSGRWAAIDLLARQPAPALPVALLLAMGGGIYGLWRGLSPLLATDKTEGESRLMQPLWLRALLTAGLAGGVWLIFSPQVILSLVGRLSG